MSDAQADGERRSGEFSRDPALDPKELFAVIEDEENLHRVLGVMREFLSRRDTHSLERGVAVYVRSARTRSEPIEKVLAALETIADELERDATPGFIERDTPLRTVVLRGVLLAFYGAEVVQREDDARHRRLQNRDRRRPDD